MDSIANYHRKPHDTDALALMQSITHSPNGYIWSPTQDELDAAASYPRTFVIATMPVTLDPLTKHLSPLRIYLRGSRAYINHRSTAWEVRAKQDKRAQRKPNNRLIVLSLLGAWAVGMAYIFAINMQGWGL